MKLRHIVAFLSGLLFSLGLGIAGMTQPTKIIGFLDFTGKWDASLAMVMIGAIGVHLASYRLIRRRSAPVLAPAFSVPTSNRIDRRLVLGAALFGLGWGLAGYCPGPALTSLATGGPVVVLVLGMLGGMLLFEVWLRAQRRAREHEPAPPRKAAAPSLQVTTPGA